MLALHVGLTGAAAIALAALIAGGLIAFLVVSGALLLFISFVMVMAR